MSQAALLSAYTLIGCRAVIGLVFALSCAGKVTAMTTFAQAIARFGIIPARWTRPAAYGIVLAEVVVVLALLIGGGWLVLGFGLAIVLLAVFAAALLRVLSRRMQVNCNCFGPAVRPVALPDVARNAIFITVGSVGLLLALLVPAALPPVSLAEAALLLLIAATLVVVALHLHDLVELFGSSLDHQL